MCLMFDFLFLVSAIQILLSTLFSSYLVYQKNLSYARSQEVSDEPWHVRQCPTSDLNRFDLNDSFGDPFSISVLGKANHFGAQSATSIALCFVWIMQESDFQWNSSSSHIQLLLQGMIRPIPNVKFAPIASFFHVSRVEAFGEAIWISPFRWDHDIVSWLVPEIITKLRFTHLPSFLDLKGLGIKGYEACTFRFEAIFHSATAHERHDNFIGSAVCGVRKCYSDFLQELLAAHGLMELGRLTFSEKLSQENWIRHKNTKECLKESKQINLLCGRWRTFTEFDIQ